MKLAIDKDLLENALKALEDSVELVTQEYATAAHLYGNLPQYWGKIDSLTHRLVLHKATITELDVAVTSALAEECRAHLKAKDLNATNRNDSNT